MTLFAATHASTRVQGLAVFFFEQDTQRQWEWMMAARLQIVEEFLNTRFVAHWRVTVRSARWALRGVNPTFSVNVVQMLRFGVMRLEVVALRIA